MMGPGLVHICKPPSAIEQSLLSQLLDNVQDLDPKAGSAIRPLYIAMLSVDKRPVA